MEIDLNNAILNDDMQEVIIHPAAAPGDLNEMMDPVQNAEEEVLQAGHNNPALDLNNIPPAQEFIAFNNQDQPQMQFPHLPIEPVIDDEEIPLHMLLNGNEADQEEE